MKQLLNTLFVTSEDVYLSVEGEMSLQTKRSRLLHDTRCIHCRPSSVFPIPARLRR